MNRSQLVPGTSVYLTHTKERRGRNRFLREFPQAWQSLPVEVRDTIFAYWKDGEPRSWVPDWPLIQLVPIIGNSDSVVGRCENGGYELYFAGPELPKLSIKALHGLILHELAHVFCYATDHPSHVPQWGHEVGEWDGEIAVRKLLKRWKLSDLQEQLDRECPGVGAWLVKN
jgi:hypothetical protein